jgi:pimeloyl-ACP methyl ester carboxylesterase
VSDSAPLWFTETLAAEPTEHEISIEGTPIRYLSWGESDKPGLVFVHGGAAHAQWWSFIAPMFTEHWHPVALHLSGHGDSGRRDSYSHEMWAQEVIEVSWDAGFPRPSLWSDTALVEWSPSRPRQHTVMISQGP